MPTSHALHILSRYDEDLTELRDLVLRMGGLVESQLSDAIDAIASGDETIAQRVVEADREIDRIELRSDQELTRLLALRAPLGSDLRTVLMLGKTVSELERIGDEAKKMGRAGLRSSARGNEAGNLPLVDPVLAMAGHARDMVHDALDALVRMDVELAQRVRLADAELDGRYAATLDEARRLMRAFPDQIDTTLEMVFVAKSFERIGDHAKNIGSYVFYIVEGRDIRHPAVNADAGDG